MIYKESLPIATIDIKEITLPYKTLADAKSNILQLDVQFDFPFMWFQTDDSDGDKNYSYFIIATGTGHDMKVVFLQKIIT